METPIIMIPRSEFHTHPLLTRLLQLHDVPEQLYIKGTLPHVTLDEYGRATPRILTIVGSRKYTEYGKNAVTALVAGLKGADVIIVSGLALGIDGIAHKTALTNNLQTFAVLGNGLNTDVMYPRSHLALSEEILEANGVLISELSPETEAAPWTFPARNRIVAALSDAVLIAEAGEKSGTLITARQALELGRDIGAIPGDIFSPSSAGPHMLIREGAYIVSNSDDLYALLHLTKKDVGGEIVSEINYTENEYTLMEMLREPMEKDLLLVKSELPLPVFLGTLSSLEMKGAIQETFGEVRRLV